MNEENLEAIEEEVEPQETQDIEEAVQSADEIVTPEDIVIPDNWEQPLKDVFTGFDEKKTLLDSIQDETVRGQLGEFFNGSKQAIYDKIKNLDSGYQTKYQDVSEQRKALETERAGFEDNRNLVNSYKGLEEQSRNIDSDLFNRETARLGGTNQYYASLHQVNSMMEKDPLNTINNMCQAYGITPQMLADGSQSPEYVARQNQRTEQQRLAELENKMLAKVEERFNTQKATETLDGFINAKDDNGELKHRYFEQVRPVMESLCQTYPDKNIEELYSIACDLHSKADGNFAKEYMQSSINAEAEKLVKENKVAKAKEVIGVKPNKTKAGVKQSLSWEQQLENQLNQEF